MLQEIDIPPNPLDALVNHFGPERVAELSGRRVRAVERKGRFVIEGVLRSQTRSMNSVSGRKQIAIVSRAGAMWESHFMTKMTGVVGCTSY